MEEPRNQEGPYKFDERNRNRYHPSVITMEYSMERMESDVEEPRATLWGTDAPGLLILIYILPYYPNLSYIVVIGYRKWLLM